MDQPTFKIRVRSRRELTSQISEFTLESSAGKDLPGFSAGAHITVETPGGAMRRYSLVRSPGPISTQTYVIAVKREPDSRGGSSSMHDKAPVGTELNIQPPENSFPLGDAAKYLLIAGGIGITPIYAMATELADQGKPFQIIYCTRSAQETAYSNDLPAAFGDRVIIHHDQGDPDKVYDFWDHFAEPQQMHVYCCGPKPLMEEIKAISGHWPEGRVNFEDFKPIEVVRPNDVAFNVHLKKLGRNVAVPENLSILEALRAAGLQTTSSCESGTCGTCKTRLIAGDVDHRDMVLTDDEKNDHIMICVSRAKSGNLTIDL